MLALLSLRMMEVEARKICPLRLAVIAGNGSSSRVHTPAIACSIRILLLFSRTSVEMRSNSRLSDRSWDVAMLLWLSAWSPLEDTCVFRIVTGTVRVSASGLTSR